EERASLALTDDYDEFLDYVAHEARSNGRNGLDVPENSLGALAYARDADSIGWRDGAQRTIVLITDACSHNEDTYTRENAPAPLEPITAPWIPTNAADVADQLAGFATVHLITQPDLD